MCVCVRPWLGSRTGFLPSVGGFLDIFDMWVLCVTHSVFAHLPFTHTCIGILLFFIETEATIRHDGQPSVFMCVCV